MAYPYYNSYMNGYYQQMPQAQTAPMTQNNAQYGQAVQGGSLVWVQGENAAKSYPITPNSTIMLMDSETQKFYLKSADASGMPLPLRIFEYSEISEKSVPEKTEEKPNINLDDYVTREEFDRRLSELSPKKKEKRIGENE